MRFFGRRSLITCGVAFTTLAGFVNSPLWAQESLFSESLLARVRAMALSVQGPRPREIRYFPVVELTARLSDLVEEADSQRVEGVIPVFQILYDARYFMVDAGIDTAGIREIEGSSAGAKFSAGRHDSIQTALRFAHRIILTHEHYDHAAGVQRGPYFTQIAAQTALTREQLNTLLAPPIPVYFHLSVDSARALRTLEYDQLLVLAPGVVLIKAPGHTPGSQFIYVRLADGREALLVGDLVWAMVGLTDDRQKPPSVSDALQEDRKLIKSQMDWVRSLMKDGSVAVVPSHDKLYLDSLLARGVLKWGLYLSRSN